MEPSLWQHQTVEPIAVPVPRNMAVQTFASGILAGIIVVATVLLWRRSQPRLRTRPRPRALVSGWSDLFRLVAGVARGALLLIVGLFVLGRVLFWPAGRRW